LADGTVIITAPTGHTYTTRPGSSLFFRRGPSQHRHHLSPRHRHATRTPRQRTEHSRCHYENAPGQNPAPITSRPSERSTTPASPHATNPRPS